MSVYIDSEKCTGCSICVPICPEQSISIIQKKAVTDNNKCTECMVCMEECPTNAIYQILDKQVSAVKRQNSIPHPVNPTQPQPKQTFRTEKRKQQPIELGDTFLSGIKRLANNFFSNEPPFGRRKRGQRKGLRRHRKRYGRGRH